MRRDRARRPRLPGRARSRATRSPMAAGLATLDRLAQPRRLRGARAETTRAARPRASPHAPRRPGSRSPPPRSAACSASSSTRGRSGTSRTRRRPTRPLPALLRRDARRAASTWRRRPYEAGFVSLAHGPREIARHAAGGRGGASQAAARAIEPRGSSWLASAPRSGRAARSANRCKRTTKRRSGGLGPARRQGLSGGARSGLRDPDRDRARLLGGPAASTPPPCSSSSAWRWASSPSCVRLLRMRGSDGSSRAKKQRDDEVTRTLAGARGAGLQPRALRRRDAPLRGRSSRRASPAASRSAPRSRR